MAHVEAIEQQIQNWRNHLGTGSGIPPHEVAELEDRLRAHLAALEGTGLSSEEAFLVALKRLGHLDAIAGPDRVAAGGAGWKQHVGLPSLAGSPDPRVRADVLVAFGLAIAAAVLVKLPVLFGIDMDTNEGFYARNMPAGVLALLTGYFVWKRGLGASIVRWLAAAFAVALVFANVYPFVPGGSTEPLTALHLPIALWVAVGAAYAGSRWRRVDGRMDFVRFSGELFIYYVLIALGGGVLTGFLMMMFQAIGIDAEWFVESWLIPCGAAGAVLVASWLVEAKQRVIENIAPMLTRLFTPLFAAMLVTFLVTLVVTGRGVDIDRDLLIGFDLLLVLVLGLLLYSVSARDPHTPPGAFDGVQVVLVISALLADAVALWAIVSRIQEFGFSPNRVAGLGVNVILLVNLAWSAVLYVRFLTRRGSFTDLERWQTNYIPVYAAWAAIVVILFPPLFGYI